MKKEKIENWGKRFDKLTNAIKFEENLKGKNIVTNEDVEIVNSDFLAKEFRGILRHYFKPFILELLAQESEKLLERIKLKEETKLFDEDEWSEGYKGGYNQAIADLEKLKEALKKNYIIARLNDEK